MRLPTRKAEKERLENQTIDNHLTKGKIERLKRELHDLESNQRPKAAEDMQFAAQDGDFSENAAYQDAKRRLRRINTRILHLTERIARAIPIEEGSVDGVIRIGSTVTIKNETGEHTYLIVGSQEVHLEHGRISHASPLGNALLGKCAGDTADIRIDNRVITWQILSVQ